MPRSTSITKHPTPETKMYTNQNTTTSMHGEIKVKLTKTKTMKSEENRQLLKQKKD